MDVYRAFELEKINEIKILSNVRLITHHDLNPIFTQKNLNVQFALSGDLRGAITCFLCLDNQELNSSDKNVIFPLFVEAMNILIGKQISKDAQLKTFKLKLSAPKISMIPREINTSYKSNVQQYELELDNHNFSIITEYSIEAIS